MYQSISIDLFKSPLCHAESVEVIGAFVREAQMSGSEAWTPNRRVPVITDD